MYESITSKIEAAVAAFTYSLAKEALKNVPVLARW